MSDKMNTLVLEAQIYSKEQIVNELLRKLPRTNLQNVIKFVKFYNDNQSKYLNTNINEIVIDCIKLVN